MTDKDFSYYRRRAEEELRAADLAERPEVSRVHRDLANRYAAMIEPNASTAEAGTSRTEPEPPMRHLRIIP